MQKIEKAFDINGVLLKVFSSLESIKDERKIELIYEMEASIPKELKGDVVVFTRLLTKVLTFVFQNTKTKEIVLSLHAPDDFLYEEFISFKLNDIFIPKERIQDYLENNITKELEILEGKIIYDKDSDVQLNIPFQINELGYRRHYRLPDIGMLGKKVLLISESKKITQSIKKMFTYFLYKVDIGFEEFKKQGNDLSQYDILVIDDCIATDTFEQIVAKVQKKIPIKYVLLRDSHTHEVPHSDAVSTYLIKPVTQESIFELIAALFHNDIQPVANRPEVSKCILDLEKILHKNISVKAEVSSIDNLSSGNLNRIIEKEKELKNPLLNIKQGEENTQKMGLIYTKELKKFVEIFDRSDIYFRQIVNEKASNKIKDFCIDLEKHSKLIGAESMFRFADIVSLIFVYDKLDMLPIYPGKYHIELQNLLEAIRKHLNIKS
ncbi:MAG: hypothetical protein DRG09_02055 [Epsilonproteobacteria bacterium]|nr:MAG: hypothetical protein DRG09_02055 [Campylobacterota bacterium]